MKGTMLTKIFLYLLWTACLYCFPTQDIGILITLFIKSFFQLDIYIHRHTDVDTRHISRIILQLIYLGPWVRRPAAGRPRSYIPPFHFMCIAIQA